MLWYIVPMIRHILLNVWMDGSGPEQNVPLTPRQSFTPFSHACLGVFMGELWPRRQA